MRLAARGALAVPAAETVEILVYLVRHNQNFGEQAALTLAGWDENAINAPELARRMDPAAGAPSVRRTIVCCCGR